MYPDKPTIKLPLSYENLQLPQIQLSHHPRGAETVTPTVVITLNRPEKHNAFTPDMARSLEEAFRMFHYDDRVKAIVLTGSGRMFCAGSDLDVGFGDGSGDPSDFRDIGGRVAVAMHRCQKPTIVALQGSAVGVGMTMTLPAAIRICHAKSKYGFVFTRRGLPLESCSSYFLPRLIGLSRAMFLITTGGVYPPEPRYFGDLFTEALPDAAQILPRALELAIDIAENVSPMASALSRALLWEGAQSPEEAHLLESRVFHSRVGSHDHKEGVNSFFEKRKPQFKADLQANWPPNYPWWSEAGIDREPKAEKESKLFISKAFITSCFPYQDPGGYETILKDENYKDLAQLSMDGRQIKNVVKISRLLAHQEKIALNVEHVRTVLDATREAGVKTT